ncbi:MAG: SIMPL domain-containing protein [Clostridia bacterium]|nr:SIMPL domain-containing protein [Clostridia bacterium]
MKRTLAILLALLLAGAAALAETATLTGAVAPAERTLTVQGVGVVKVNADRATINLGVREVAPDVMTAQSTVNEKLDAVIVALKAAGAAESAISTDGIGIYPNYDYSEDERIVGYTAYNSISVTLTDVENVGSYIDAAFAAGANSLDYVQFSAADTGDAADQALALAVESARRKAQVLAEAAGVELGEILELRDSADSGYDANMFYAKSEAAADMGAGTQVLASQQQVSASVYITFAIGD